MEVVRVGVLVRVLAIVEHSLGVEVLVSGWLAWSSSPAWLDKELVLVFLTHRDQQRCNQGLQSGFRSC